MSTKSTIVYTEDIEAYTETSEPIIEWGKHRGYKIYILASHNVSISCDGDYFTLTRGPKSFKISCFIVDLFESDCDGILIRVSAYDIYDSYKPITDLIANLNELSA